MPPDLITIIKELKEKFYKIFRKYFMDPFTMMVVCRLGKGRLPLPDLMNFRKTSKRPLTPPENNVALFFGRAKNVQRNSFEMA